MRTKSSAREHLVAAVEEEPGKIDEPGRARAQRRTRGRMATMERPYRQYLRLFARPVVTDRDGMTNHPIEQRIGMGESYRLQHVLGEHLLPGRMPVQFDDSPGDITRCIGIAEATTRFVHHRDVGQTLEVARDAVVVSTRVVIRTVIDTARHRKQLARRDRLMSTTRRNPHVEIRRHGGIEVDVPAFDELHESDRVEDLSRRADLEERFVDRGNRPVGVGDPGCRRRNPATRHDRELTTARNVQFTQPRREQVVELLLSHQPNPPH